MSRCSQGEKNSFLGTRLGRFAGRLLRRPQKSNEATSPIVESGPSITKSFGPAAPAYRERKSEESTGSRKNGSARGSAEHIEPTKQKKAITHIEKLLGQIAELQDEIDTGLHAEISFEQEIFHLLAADKQPSHPNPQRKQVKGRRKQQADKLPAAKGSVHKHKGQSYKDAEKDEGHRVNNNTLVKKLHLRKKRKRASVISTRKPQRI
jgi:hypothetical protein